MLTVEQSRKDKFQYDKELYKKRFTIWAVTIVAAALVVIPAMIWLLLNYLPVTEVQPQPPEEAVASIADEVERNDQVEQDDPVEQDEQVDPIDDDTQVESSNPDIANPPAQMEENHEEGTVSISFVGDILLGSTVHQLLSTHGYDYPYFYVREWLQKPDVMIGNLETPITERGEPADKSYVFRSSPEVLPAFKEAGFDLVSLANNHILDYGHEGLEDTFSFLNDHGIAYMGAGMNDDEAYEPVIIEKNGIQTAFLNFSWVVPETGWKATPYQPGVADTYNHLRPVQEITAAKEQADLVIVTVHWGTEREEEASDQQRQMARAYIDAGADLVIGSHPHVLQGLENYNGKWIAYSLGNFIFTTNDHAPTWDSMIFQASCQADGHCDAELIPILTKWAQPKQADSENSERIYQQLRRLSNGYGVQIDNDGRLLGD